MRSRYPPILLKFFCFLYDVEDEEGRMGDEAIVAPNLRCRGTSPDNGGVFTFIHDCYCLLTLPFS